MNSLESITKRITGPVSELRDNLSQKIRDKAISRTETRILIAGKKIDDFNEEELEVIVKEEEDKLKQQLKEKGLMALVMVLGMGWLS